MPLATSDPRTQTSPLWIKLNGEELSEDITGQIVDVRIEQDLVLPDAFTLRILDIADQAKQAQQDNFPLLEADKFGIGKSIEIGLGREEKPLTVLKGDITSLEMEARGNGLPMLTVRGYDASYRLHFQRETKTYLQVTDSDLAEQVAARNGLTAKADTTRVLYEHVFQDNQTDWQFLRSRAAKVGYELFVQDHNLVFRKPVANEPPPELTFGETLHRVRLRLSGTSQVSRVVVKSWDPKTKQTIQADATQPSQRAQIGNDKERGKTLSQLGSNSQAVFPRQTVTTVDEARELAQAHYDAIAGDFIRLEAVTHGDARIKPGRSVKFKNLGVRFDHEYYVSSAVHRVTPAEGYTTEFTVSGRRPPTLMDLLSGGTHDGQAAGGGGGGGAGAGKQQGVVVGIVTNNKDDEMGGRVKVKYPWLGDEESHWARLVTPMAGSGRGMYFLPEVGDEVIVALEHGDINHAYVLGGVWNGQEKPPKTASAVVDATGKVNQRILQSRLGHTITLDDSVDKPSITIVDKTGQNSISIDSQTNKVSIKVMGDISLEAPQGTISIKGMGVQVEATGPAKVKGATTGIEANGPVTVRGATVSIN